MKTGGNKVSTTNNVFKGSGTGIFTTTYRSTTGKRSLRIRPEQVDGDITVSDYSGKSVSQQTLSSKHSPYKLQTIYD